MTEYDYIKDGNAIYEKSFAIIRAEADLARFSEDEADVAVRMIHACGLVEAAQHLVFSPGFVGAMESKEALAENSYGVPFAIVRGRMGGSAMTAAALNSLARAGL